MLRISQSGMLAVFALNYLSKRPDRMVPAHEIADWGGLSRNTLVRILQGLRRQGIVRATRGDGFELARPADRITLMDVVTATDGSTVLEEVCLMGRGRCELGPSCAIATFCDSTRSAVRHNLEQITLDKLPADSEGRPICLQGD